MKEECEALQAAVISATGFWADRHPELYFNFTDPIDNKEQAELVITADWDVYSKRGEEHTLAFQTTRAGGHDVHRIVFNPFVCFRFNKKDLETIQACATVTEQYVLFMGIMFALLFLAGTTFACMYAAGHGVREKLTHQVLVDRDYDDIETQLRIELLLEPAFRPYAMRYLRGALPTSEAPEDGGAGGGGEEGEGEGGGEGNGGGADGDELGDELDSAAGSFQMNDLVVAHGLSKTIFNGKPAIVNGAFGQCAEERFPIEWLHDSTLKQANIRPQNLRAMEHDDLCALLKIDTKNFETQYSGKVRYHCLTPLVFLLAVVLLVVGVVLDRTCAQSSTTGEGLRECTSFEGVLVHELGHVLGVGHPDQTYRIDTNSNTSVHDFVPIDHHDPCASVQVFGRQQPCAELKSHECSRRHYCKLVAASVEYGAGWGQRASRCVSIYDETIMHSTVSPETTKNSPTEDDLAALFFLYPSRLRDPAIGTRALPLQHYTVHKLRAIAEDHHEGQCATLVDKQALVECLLGDKVEAALGPLQRMTATNCERASGGAGLWSLVGWSAKSADGELRQECDTLGKLSAAARHALEFVRKGKGEGEGKGGAEGSAAHGEETRRHQEHLAYRRAEAEDELDDRTNTWTPSADVDSLIDALLVENDRDMNDDGVHDADRDADGLPDQIEDGLDILNELLDEVGSGRYHGRWDADQDGIPDQEDEHHCVPGDGDRADDGDCTA